VWTVDREKTGQMLAFNKSVTVGFRTGFNHINDNLARSFSGYASLFAIPENNESAQADQLLKEWLIDMHPEARVRGMVLTPERLFVAGRLYHTNPIENPAAYDMGNGNFTVAVLFQISEKHWTGTNLVSKAPLLGGLNSGGKEMFFKDDRIHYSIDGLGILTSENEVSYGKWHQVVLTDHCGEVRLYIDGKLEGKKEQFTQPDVKGHVLKVEDRRGFRKLNGEISEVRYYGRHLDDTAAKSLSLGKEPGGAAPALLWKPAPDQPKSVEELPNVVRIYSVADGQILGEYPVKEEFIHDCLAVAGDRLYVSTEKGLICLGEK